jgi:hypothetical protein
MRPYTSPTFCRRALSRTPSSCPRAGVAMIAFLGAEVALILAMALGVGRWQGGSRAYARHGPLRADHHLGPLSRAARSRRLALGALYRLSARVGSVNDRKGGPT